MKVSPYLNYGGNCEEAFRFYEKHIGAKVTFKMTHEQAPAPGNVPDDWKKKILYAHMLIGESEIMGSDVPSDRFQLCAASISRSPSPATRKPNAFMPCFLKAAKSSCPCRKRFLPTASACCETNSARPG
jgi:uncharacterized glyoxalase superfamily protein PhnB